MQVYALVQSGWRGREPDGQTFIYKKGNAFSLSVPQGATVAEWKTSNAKTATVVNGKVTLRARGDAVITAVLGNGTAWTYKVTVKFSFLQWLLYIFCFGWIWMK